MVVNGSLSDDEKHMVGQTLTGETVAVRLDDGPSSRPTIKDIYTGDFSQNSPEGQDGGVIAVFDKTNETNDTLEVDGDELSVYEGHWPNVFAYNKNQYDDVHVGVGFAEESRFHLYRPDESFVANGDFEDNLKAFYEDQLESNDKPTIPPSVAIIPKGKPDNDHFYYFDKGIAQQGDDYVARGAEDTARRIREDFQEFVDSGVFDEDETFVIIPGKRFSKSTYMPDEEAERLVGWTRENLDDDADPDAEREIRFQNLMFETSESNPKFVNDFSANFENLNAEGLLARAAKDAGLDSSLSDTQAFLSGGSNPSQSQGSNGDEPAEQAESSEPSSNGQDDEVPEPPEADEASGDKAQAGSDDGGPSF